MPNSNVAVGTYESHRYNTMGNKEANAKLQAILRKKQGSQFSMLKIEDSNRKWIDRARKEYMAGKDLKTGVPSVAQLLEASGFDPAEYDCWIWNIQASLPFADDCDYTHWLPYKADEIHTGVISVSNLNSY